MEPVFSLPLP